MKREEILKVFAKWHNYILSDDTPEVIADAILALEQKEQPQPERSAWEILDKYDIVFRHGEEWVFNEDVLLRNPVFKIVRAMKEYRNQGLPEVTNYKAKYEKCIDIIKRFDPGIIGMYDL